MIGKSIESAEEVSLRQAPSGQSVKPVRTTSGGFTVFIASIALFFTAVGIAAGYKHWQRMHDWVKDNARQVAVLESALARKMDTQDLSALLNRPVNNARPVSEKINRLLAQLPELKAKPELTLSAADAESPSPSPSSQTAAPAVSGASNNHSSWDGYKQRALAALDGVVLIQKLEPSVMPVLQAEAQEAAHTLIRLQLESLRLMALQNDRASYQQQINLLRATLDEYMVRYAPERAKLCQQILDELATIELQS